MSNALLSNMSVDTAEKCGLNANEFLKNAAITYDHIFFYTGLFGKWEGINQSDLISWVASWAVENESEARELSKNKQFRDTFPDARELWADLEKYNPFTENVIKATRDERLLSPIRRIMARTYAVSEDAVTAGRCGNTWLNIPALSALDLATLLKIREIEKDITGVFTEAHVTLFAEDIYEQGIPGDPMSRLLMGGREDFEKSIFPDFSVLDWDQILELRGDHRIKEFRQKLASLSIGDFRYDPATQTPLWREYLRSLEALAKDVAPKPVKSGILGVLGNFPLPFPNPVSILSSGMDMVEQTNRRIDYGWLYFIQAAKEMALRSPHTIPTHSNEPG
jgi:uncharacterized protein (DUF2249 family)